MLVTRVSFLSAIIGLDYRDYIGENSNGFENIYKSYFIFIGSTYASFKANKIFRQSTIRYIDKSRYILCINIHTVC